MFDFKSKVRYSECDKDLNLKLSSIVNYFQDTSTFQSEELGVGMAYLKDNDSAWVLSNWQIVINRYPKLGEEITVYTWAHDLVGFMSGRNFVMKDSEGEVLAYADSLWVFIDTLKGKPKKVNDAQIELYQPKEAYNMNKGGRKIKLPQEFIEKDKFKIREDDIDSNGHVNNEKYIQMAMVYLKENCLPKSVRVEYKNQARLGDTIKPFVSKEDNKIVVILKNIEMKPYAVVEFCDFA